MDESSNCADDPINSFVGNRISELCLKNGISKYRLAKITGITETNIAHYVSGKTLPSLHQIKRICNAFGITLAQFFSQSDRCTELTGQELAVARLWSDLTSEDRAGVFRHMQALRCLEEAETAFRSKAGDT